MTLTPLSPAEVLCANVPVWVLRELAAWLSTGRAGSLTLHTDGVMVRKVERLEMVKGEGL